MRRKRIKLLKRIVVFTLTLGALLGTFSVFSSAAVPQQETTTYQIKNSPNRVYYLFDTGNSSNYSIAQWEMPEVTAHDRSAFFAVGNRSGEGFWHLMPFVQGQQSADSVLSNYNAATPSVSVAEKMYKMSSLMSSGAWTMKVAYSTKNNGFIVILQLSETFLASWTNNWKPLYRIDINFIDRDGQIATYVPSGTFADMSVLAEGVIKDGGGSSSQSYPFFDCGVLTRYFKSNLIGDVKGVQLNVYEYFYPNDGSPYPINAADFQKNLIMLEWSTDTYKGAYFKSYPFKYYFEDEGFEARKQYSLGYNTGKADGYEQGKLAGMEASSNYNAVDGIVALAQVPGAFISGMLDFNFFGVNLASTVKAIFTLLVVAFIVVLLLKFLL